ncbi:MAG: zinc ABC transporter substrate-binding protein, partial [Planctomycetes bacterium]|nr:zinc ABC transporter substrate-binding protein [Planctomycetota bacterium]
MVFFMIASLFLGCEKQSDQDKSGLTGDKIRAVATTGMIADAVKNVGGDFVQVTALMGPGVDPHLYKASAGDVT